MHTRSLALLLTALLFAACGGGETPSPVASDEPSGAPVASETPSEVPAASMTFDGELLRWNLAALTPDGAATVWRPYGADERYRGPETIAATAIAPLSAMLGEIAAPGRYAAELAVFPAGELTINLMVNGAAVVHPICAPLPDQASVVMIGGSGATMTTSEAAARGFTGTAFGLAAVGFSYTVPDAKVKSVHHIYTCVVKEGRELLLRQRIHEQGARESGAFTGDWAPFDAVWPSMLNAIPALVPAE